MENEGRWLDMDRFVDVEGLRALDDEVRRGILRLVDQHGLGDSMMGNPINRFFPSLPDLRWDKSKPVLSKLSTINLQLPRAYTSIHLQADSDWTEMADAFPGLVAWAKTLPFEQFGRFFVIFDR
ncbi:MAG: hypothetical protein AAF211_15165, partial [Myxococcota bacterium]